MESILLRVKYLFRIDPLPSPAMLWCFYRYPYRIGISATLLTGLLVGGIVLGAFLIGCLSWTLIAALGVVFLGCFYAACLCFGYLGFEGKSVPFGLLTSALALAIWYWCHAWVHRVTGSIFSVAAETFYAFSAPLQTVTGFLTDNPLLVLGIIAAPALATLLVAGLSMGTMYLLQGVEWIVLNVHGIHFKCAYTDCNHPTEPARYHCPKCDHPHEVPLLPSRFGVFFHGCTQCGSWMPTMMLLGRNRRLDRDCRECGRPVGKVVGIDRHVCLVGPRKSGKTCLLIQSTALLLQQVKAAVAEEAHQREFEGLHSLVQSGQVPPQTQKVNASRAFQLQVPHKPYPYHLYLYDIAGEHYQDFDEVEKFGYFANSDAILFLLDPFSSKTFRASHPPPDGVEVAEQPPQEVLRNVIQALTRFDAHAKRLKHISINVVLVKGDLQYLRLPAEAGPEVRKTLIRDFIIHQMDEGAFVHQLEGTFGPRVNYLLLSSLGRTPTPEDRSPFRAQHLDGSLTEIFRAIGIKSLIPQTT